MSEKKDLVQIIKDNPGCIAEIDNDYWVLRKNTPRPEGFDNWEWQKQEAWFAAQILAKSGEVIPRGSGYGSGNCYGGDILQALAEIVGITVESV